LLSDQDIVMSPEMSDVWQIAESAANSDVPVVVRGETGTGKEVIARLIHRRSNRAEEPFVAVNCGAIPAELLESELFGHRKGAFTGAVFDHKGRFELAGRGTLFLDEIGDMATALQVKLLRVLEESSVTPVGASKPVSIKARIIAATHRDLDKMIESGSFREDLFYRLNVIPVFIPPLRERMSEFDALVQLLNSKHGSKSRTVRFSSTSIELLRRYSWPGNIRELSNFIARCNALWPGTEIELDRLPISMLPSGMRGSAELSPRVDSALPPEDALAEGLEGIIGLAQGWQEKKGYSGKKIELKKLLQDVESRLITAALDETAGNVSAAAKRLHLQRTTLVQRISKLGIRD
jgi:sigma-54 specific flagellar transcriptional regulator A